MENINEPMETEQIEKQGLSRDELQSFFNHVYDFCRTCPMIKRGCSPEGCKKNDCVLFMIRNIPTVLKYKPKLLDRLLIDRVQPDATVDNPRSRRLYPTML